MRLWESAERSNTAEDYKAYLEAHPTGYFAALARNRIAKLQGGAGSDKPALVVDEAELKAQAGTAQTEAGISLAQTERVEAQNRLRLAGFDPGSPNGKFGPSTRQAVVAWQKSRSIPETGYLTKMQHAALHEQTQGAYNNWLSTQSEARSIGQPQPAARRVQTQARAEPQPRYNSRPAPRQSGPSLGEVGQFLGGVGSLVGGFRR
jgi:peptidoglycan hydrolase-like protein with peptidoglycan-binding domain